jgi:hypothetical protein
MKKPTFRILVVALLLSITSCETPKYDEDLWIPEREICETEQMLLALRQRQDPEDDYGAQFTLTASDTEARLERYEAALEAYHEEFVIPVLSTREKAEYLANINRLISIGIALPEVDFDWGHHQPTIYDLESILPGYDLRWDEGLSPELQYWTYELCVAYGIEEYYELIISLFWHESRFRNVVSSPNNNGSRDHGVAQINDSNHGKLRRALGITDFLDPYQSILCGVHWISRYLHCFADIRNDEHNEVHRALMNYHQGPGAESRWSNGTRSTSYSRLVASTWHTILESRYQLNGDESHENGNYYKQLWDTDSRSCW